MRINISTTILAAGLTSGVASTEASSKVPSPPVLSSPLSSLPVTSSRLHDRSYAAHLSLLEQNRRTVELLPPSCNLNACLGLTGTLSCIASALQARDPAALSKCLTDGMQDICSCAACVPAAIRLLNALGICLSAPGGNTTATPSVSWSTFVTAAAVLRDSGVMGDMTATPTMMA